MNVRAGQSEKPPAPPDCYIVVGLFDHPEDGVWGSAQVWVVAAASEEEAVGKVSPLSNAQQFVALLAHVLDAAP